MSVNIPRTGARRVVVVGGGFGGLKLCSTLSKDKNYQVVLIDHNNYHQFPPLIYQVATAGLQVSSISFPFRKVFSGGNSSVIYRMCEMRYVNTKDRTVQTSIGKLDYDYLVLATGTTTNYFGNSHIEDASMPMKTLNESLGLRNALLNTFERASTCATEEERRQLLNFVIVGGGPSGVEIAGALAEMRQHVLPQDYPDLDASLMQIRLLQGGDRLLPAMSKTASEAALRDLRALGVDVQLKSRVRDYVNDEVLLSDGRKINSKTMIWVCGITGRRIDGISEESYAGGNRLRVDRFNRVEGYDNVFAVGDIACMPCPGYPNGHPQMAQPAIQQGENLARNFMRMAKGQARKPFHYRDLGSMATIGRNRAVADIAGMNLTGFTAWFLWMAVHLMSILGVKNKVSVLLDWAWSYFTYDKSNRILIAAKHPKVILERNYRMAQTHWGDKKVEQHGALDADLGLDGYGLARADIEKAEAYAASRAAATAAIASERLAMAAARLNATADAADAATKSPTPDSAKADDSTAKDGITPKTETASRAKKQGPGAGSDARAGSDSSSRKTQSEKSARASSAKGADLAKNRAKTSAAKEKKASISSAPADGGKS